ncbi:MAG: ABC transporter substrate-binding protein [Acidimicrobiia bacterium]
MQKRLLRRAAVAGLAFGLIAAACGDDSSESDSSPTTAGGASTTAAGSATTASGAVTTAGGAATTAGAPKNTTGFDGTTIKVGMIAALSGPVSGPIGIPIANGNRVFFEALNKAGGIGGKYKVQLVEADSKYDVAETAKQYGAIKDQVVGITQVIGTPMVQGLLQTLSEDKVLVQPATLDSIWYKEQYLMPILAPYQIQAINGIGYYVQQNGKDKKVCALTMDSAYGEAGLEGATFAAQQLGITLASKQLHKQGDTDFTAQINALRDAKCDAVWLTSLPSETANIIGRAVQANFKTQWIAQSPTWNNLFVLAPIAPYLKDNFWWVSDASQWGDTSLKGMSKMIDDIKASSLASQIKPDPYFTFGYLEAWAYAQVLEQAVKGGDLSRAGVLKALNSVGTVKFDGLASDQTVGDPSKRNPSRTVAIFKVTPESGGTNGGLTPVATNVSIDAAKAFKF